MKRTAIALALITMVVSTAQAGPSVREVSRGLSASKTEIQREAFWETVKNQNVRWTVKVDDVKKKWFGGYKVQGTAANNLLVICEVDGKDTATKTKLSLLSKGDRVICRGQLGSVYVMLFGVATTVVEGGLE